MKQAWLLSGGGARGAFQAGAIFELYNTAEYRPSYVGGISVGALNGLAVACGKVNEIAQIWHTIDTPDVYNKKTLSRAFRLGISQIGLSKAPKSIYSTAPLRRYLEKQTEGWEFVCDFCLGVVDIDTGKYEERWFPAGGLVGSRVLDYVMASAAIPAIFPPVEINGRGYVDGGVKHQTPLTALLSRQPDEVIIITNNDLASESGLINREGKNSDFVQIGLSTLDILLTKAFNSDMDRYFERNFIAQTQPGERYEYKGKIIKYFPTILIKPAESLGDSLDFSPKINRTRFRHGSEQAADALVKT